MKKILYGLLSVLLILTLSGCGETDEDYKNAKNHMEFLKSELSKRFEDNVIIGKEIDGTNKDKDIYIYSAHLESEELNFQVSTYWHVSDAIPSRHYRVDDNHEYLMIDKILSKGFENTIVDYTTEEYIDRQSGLNKIDEYVVNIQNEEDFDLISNIFYNITSKHEGYLCTIKVNYNTNFIRMNLSSELNKDDYKIALSKLIK